VQGDSNRCLVCTDPTFAVDKNDNQDFGTCKKFFAPIDLGAGCYADKFTDTPIDGCSCDPSCLTCGYGQASDASKPDRCLRCSNPAFVVDKLPNRDYGPCAAPNRRRLEGQTLLSLPELTRTRGDGGIDGVKDVVSQAQNTQGEKIDARFDSANRFRVKRNSSWAPCLDDTRTGLARYDSQRCTSAAESCGYFENPEDRNLPLGQRRIEVGCILT
jgi:hypothetical protein